MPKALRKPKHQPIPELVKAMAMEPEKRAKVRSVPAAKRSGWSQGGGES